MMMIQSNSVSAFVPSHNIHHYHRHYHNVDVPNNHLVPTTTSNTHIQNHHNPNTSIQTTATTITTTSRRTRTNNVRLALIPSSTSSMSTMTSNHHPNTIILQIKTILHTLSNITSSLSSLNHNNIHAFQNIKDLLINTSPTIYFSCLILAGLGVPISEDALCIFIGSILPILWMNDNNKVLRMKLILALYLGVVLSDVLTFSIGRIMGMGLLEPLSKRLNLRSKRIEFCNDDNNDDNDVDDNDDNAGIMDVEEEEEEENSKFCEIPTDELRSKDNILAILEKAGNYAGFVVRFSVGMRLPLMLAAGFSGKVPISKFIVGTCIGGLFSLSIQLGLGAIMSNNPAMIIATIACISATPVVVPSLVAFFSWINLMYKRWSMFRPKRIS